MKRFVFIAALSFQASLAWATPYEQIVQTQTLLETRVNSLIQLYDPKGFSVVNLELKPQKETVPGSPFFYEDLLIGADQKLDIGALDVVVISRLESLPDNVKTLIQESLRSFSKTVRVQSRQVNPTASTLNQPVTEMRLTLPESSHLALRNFAGILGLLALIGLVLFGSLGSRIGKIASQLGAGLGGLKESLENGGLGSSSASGSTESNHGAHSSDAPSLAWSQLSKESCLALLSDCYWCYKDGYAAYIWDQLPIIQRMSVVAAWPVLEKYVRHIQSASAYDLGLHTDVNYLSPLPFTSLDNTALTEQVKKFPALLARLSPLRSDALELGVQERLLLQGKASESTQIPDLRLVAASAQRPLLGFSPVHLRSEAGETEAISLRELPVEAKEQFITLAWMVQLPSEKVTALLAGFSARELADAWLGPAALLTYLGECLSPKKRALVESYLKTVTPSRDSQVFVRLHRLAMEAFRQQKALAEPGGGDHAQAA